MKNNIQALRAVAAIMVVVLHTVNGMPVPPGGSPIHALFTVWGMSGVDLFFVISGLVMVLAQSGNPKPFAQFMRGRAVRILPMYWLLTLVYSGLLLFLPQLFNDSAFDLRQTLASLSLTNWLFTGRGPVVYVGWTLEYEFVFYLLFAAAAALVPLRWAPLPVAAALAAGVGLAGLNSALLEFVYGMLIGVALLQWRRIPAALAWGALVVGVGAHVATAPIGLPISRAIVWGLPSAVIVLGLVFVPQIRPGALTYLGAASYSIYLIQVLTIPALLRLVARMPADVPYTVKVLAISVMTVLVGCAAHQFVEAPMTRWWTKRIGAPRPPAAMVARAGA